MVRVPHIKKVNDMTLFTPASYDSLVTMREVSILDAHSDTVFQGLDVFGYYEGCAYEAQYVYDEVSDATYAVAGDCIDEIEIPVVRVPQYEIDLVDVCGSQYFRGHHKLCFQLLVTGYTTYKELKVDMLDWQNNEHIENLDWDAYQTAVDDFFSVVKCDMSERVFPTLDAPLTDEEAEEWDCYAFFTIDTGEDDE